METKKLRYGNLVKDVETNEVVIFVCIDPDTLNNRCYIKFRNSNSLWDKGWPNADIKPIKITNKWLKNSKDWDFIDYEKRIVLNYMRYKGIKIEICTDKTAVYFRDNLINYIDYIHELQNLFYSLTKDELIFRTHELHTNSNKNTSG